MPKLPLGSLTSRLLLGAVPILLGALWLGAANSQDASRPSISPALRSRPPLGFPVPERDVKAKVEILPLPPDLKMPPQDSLGVKTTPIEVAAQLPPLSALESGTMFWGDSRGFGMPYDARFALRLKGWPALEPLSEPDLHHPGIELMEEMHKRRILTQFFIRKAYARANASQPWHQFPIELMGETRQLNIRSASWNGSRYLMVFVKAWGGGQWRYEAEMMGPRIPFARGPRQTTPYYLRIEVAAPIAGAGQWPPPWARNADEARARAIPITGIEYRSTLNPQWRPIPKKSEKGFPLVVPRRGGHWEFRAVFRDPKVHSREVWPLWSGRYFNSKFIFSSGETMRWFEFYSYRAESNAPPTAMEEIVNERGSKSRVLEQNHLFELQVQGTNTFKTQIKIGPDGYAKGDYEYDQPIEEGSRYEFSQILRPTHGFGGRATIGLTPRGAAPQSHTFEARIDAGTFFYAGKPVYRSQGVRVRFRSEDKSIAINGPGAGDDIAVCDSNGRVSARIYPPEKAGSTVLWAEILGSNDKAVKSSSLQLTFASVEARVVYGKWRLSDKSTPLSEVFERPLWIWQGLPMGGGSYQNLAEAQTLPIRLRDRTAPQQIVNPKRVWLSGATLKTEANVVYQAPDEKQVPPGAMQYFRADPAFAGTRQLEAFEVVLGAPAGKTP